MPDRVPARIGRRAVLKGLVATGGAAVLAGRWTAGAEASSRLSPSVSGISPTSGSTAGGTTVTIEGRNLAGATAVRFGSAQATVQAGGTSSQLVVTAPPGSGTAELTVTTRYGTSRATSATAFGYVAPAPQPAPEPPATAEPAPTSTPSGAASSYTRRSGFPVVNEAAIAGSQLTQAITTAAVGDIIVVCAWSTLEQAPPAPTIADVASVTDSNGYISWQPAKSAYEYDTYRGDAAEIWFGTVNQVGTTTVTVNWASSTDDLFMYVDSWSSDLGSSSTWSVTSSAGYSNTDESSAWSDTCEFPALTASSGGGLYWGYCYTSFDDTDTTASDGTPSGCEYFISPSYGNCIGVNGTLAPGATCQPQCYQQASTEQWWVTTAAIFVASA